MERAELQEMSPRWFGQCGKDKSPLGFHFYCVALMNTLCHNGKEDTVPTVGFNIETVKVKKLSLDLWARRWQNGL